MYRTIDEFERVWAFEAGSTARILRALTDASLAQSVTADDRTLGRMAWHLTQTLPEMMGRTGLRVVGPAEDTPAPPSAAGIAEAYEAAAQSLMEQIRAHWDDATLEVEDEMYGERWKRSGTLAALVGHQIHHRGQMTVLMRQAGLRVPGIYGPSREEWTAHGMQPPAV